MGKFNFYYQDQWKDFDPTPSGEHPNFPATNTKLDDYRSAVWQSLHGEGSNWGYFYIGAPNKYIDFNEGGADLAATLTVGAYTAVGLVAEIKTQMEATGALTYTPEYIETGADKGKFKIAASGSYDLKCNTGTNKANAVWDTIGFDDASDKTGAATYTADDGIRIHNEEILSQDFTAALNFYGCVVVGHNKSASGTVYIEFSSDAFSSVAVSTALTASTENSQVLYTHYASAQSYRYARIRVVDPENSDYYVWVGTVKLLLQSFEPNVNYDPFKYSQDEPDPSLIITGPDGNESGIDYTSYTVWNYNFYVRSADVATFKTIISDRGRLGSLVIVEDWTTGSPPTGIPRFVAISYHNWRPINKDENVWSLDLTFRELR